MDIEVIDRAFRDYVSKFDKRNKKIRLKFDHTFEVVKVMEKICKKMNLNEEDTLLAKAIAYFHDIGRFEQAIKTGTFKDDVMDHANNGVALLFEDGLIDKFHIDKKYHDLIRISVKNHNKLEVEKNLSEREKLFVNLIRDADKIDIYRVICKYYIMGKRYKFETEPNSINVENFFNHRLINNNDKRTMSDNIISSMALIYDINYKESFEVLKETGYYRDYLSKLNASNEKEDLLDKMKKEVIDYLKERNAW